LNVFHSLKFWMCFFFAVLMITWSCWWFPPHRSDHLDMDLMGHGDMISMAWNCRTGTVPQEGPPNYVCWSINHRHTMKPSYEVMFTNLPNYRGATLRCLFVYFLHPAFLLGYWRLLILYSNFCWLNLHFDYIHVNMRILTKTNRCCLNFPIWI